MTLSFFLDYSSLVEFSHLFYIFLNILMIYQITYQITLRSELLIAEVSKLCHRGQIHPIAYFYVAHEVKIVFTFYKV